MRYPAVSGMFYPADKSDLESIIDMSLSKAEIPELSIRRLIGVVVPHAGYEYSGTTAAYSYNILKKYAPGRDFVILGPNHRGTGSSISTTRDDWRTPLGDARVNVDIMNEILSEAKIVDNDPRSHQAEHSIEVQIPFLQRIFGNDFSFVPLSLWYQEEDVTEILGNVLSRHSDEFSIIASSDLNHYQKKEITDHKDLELIARIEELDIKGFYKTLRDLDVSACGYGAIATLMRVTVTLGGKIKLIHHTTSGEVTGYGEPVVGYASLVSYL
ncbi:MAG: AmmeMemoRadiSam system protein B [Thermoplasmataceae archaeon]